MQYHNFNLRLPISINFCCINCNIVIIYICVLFINYNIIYIIYLNIFVYHILNNQLIVLFYLIIALITIYTNYILSCKNID